MKREIQFCQPDYCYSIPTNYKMNSRSLASKDEQDTCTRYKKMVSFGSIRIVTRANLDEMHVSESFQKRLDLQLDAFKLTVIRQPLESSDSENLFKPSAGKPKLQLIARNMTFHEEDLLNFRNVSTVLVYSATECYDRCARLNFENSLSSDVFCNTFSVCSVETLNSHFKCTFSFQSRFTANSSNSKTFELKDSLKADANCRVFELDHLSDYGQLAVGREREFDKLLQSSLIEQTTTDVGSEHCAFLCRQGFHFHNDCQTFTIKSIEMSTSNSSRTKYLCSFYSRYMYRTEIDLIRRTRSQSVTIYTSRCLC